MQEYEQYLVSKSDKTVSGYIKNVSYFLDWLEANNLKLNEVTPLVIKLYSKELNKVGYASSTINAKYAALRSFLKFLSDKKGIYIEASDVLKSIRFKIDTEKWLTPEEKNIVLLYFDPDKKNKNKWRAIRDAAIAHIMLNAGLRISEVESLKMSDINKDVITVRLTKGAAQRYIPINRTLYKMLQKWLEVRNTESPFVFLSQKGKKPLTASGIEHIFKRMNKELGTSIWPHRLRHTFAHDLLTLGVDIVKISELLGHADVRTTILYLTPSKSELLKAVQTLDD